MTTPCSPACRPTLARRRLRIVVLAALLALVWTAAAAHAAPLVFTDLGTITDSSATYFTPDLAQTVTGLDPGEVLWFRFAFAGTAGTSGFLDIDTSPVGMAPAATHAVDTELALYDNLGNLIAVNDDFGQGFYSRLTFGSSAPRTYDVGGGIGPLGGTPGQHGTLDAGTYWLALAEFPASFDTDFDATSEGEGDPDAFDLNVRVGLAVQEVPEPATLLLIGTGLGLAGLRRRRRRKD